jgi:hypothetical protein
MIMKQPGLQVSRLTRWICEMEHYLQVNLQFADPSAAAATAEPLL